MRCRRSVGHDEVDGDEVNGNVDMACAQVLTESFGLRVGANGGGDTVAEETVDHEVERVQIRQFVAVHREVGRFGDELLHPVNGEELAQPVPRVIVGNPHTHVRLAALVTRAGGNDTTQRLSHRGTPIIVARCGRARRPHRSRLGETLGVRDHLPFPVCMHDHVGHHRASMRAGQ